MKNKPMALQIWLVFASISLGIAISLALILLVTLRIFFTNEIFQTIEDVQRSIWSDEVIRQESPTDMLQTQQNQRMVNHMILFQNGNMLNASPLPRSVLQQIYTQALEQNQIDQRYNLQVNDSRLLYVIRKGMVGFRTAYLVSYMYDTYPNTLARTLFKQIVYVLAIVLLISSLPSILLARYLSRPIVQIEKHVKRLANREWKSQLIVERQDEIGQLAQSIEKMREQLVKQDELQQSMLQHISHELKTPVMVIQSYAQSIQDGIYPKGDLDASVDVIQQESARLEKLVHNLLYLTKLDYLATQQLQQAQFRLDQLITAIIERLKWQRSDLEWELEIEPCTVLGDAEQWTIALENVLDNQIRYAASTIFVSLKLGSNQSAIIRIGNDGAPIAEEKQPYLFQTYVTGQQGKFGLGLAIVQRILTLHNASISVHNTPQGVFFTIQLPTDARGTNEKRD